MKEATISKEKIKRLQEGEEVELQIKLGQTIKIKPNCSIKGDHNWRWGDRIRDNAGKVEITRRCIDCDKKDKAVVNGEELEPLFEEDEQED